MSKHSRPLEGLSGFGPYKRLEESSEPQKTGHPCPPDKTSCSRSNCRYNLRNDWNRHDGQRPEGLACCAIECANNGPLSHIAVAALMGVTKQRIQQIEHRAMDKLWYQLQRLRKHEAL